MKQQLSLEPELTMNMETRLDRIEEKLDSLTEAMVALARAEEKIAGIKEDQLSWLSYFTRLIRSYQKTITKINHISI